jgi:hypothetical protein
MSSNMHVSSSVSEAWPNGAWTGSATNPACDRWLLQPIPTARHGPIALVISRPCGHQSEESGRPSLGTMACHQVLGLMP